MTINSASRSIILTKKEMAAASKYGSDAYVKLQQARRDYPGFDVVTVSRKTTGKRETFKGLTYEYMEKYIIAHDDENNSIMAEFKMLRGTSEEAVELLADSATYKEMKDWFLKKFPAIAEFHKRREALLSA